MPTGRMRRKVARFERRPAPSPSFNRGWRLGVSFGAAAVLLVIAWLLLATLREVCNV